MRQTKTVPVLFNPPSTPPHTQLVLVLNAPGPDHPAAAACQALADRLWRSAGGGSTGSGQQTAAAPLAAAAAAAPSLVAAADQPGVRLRLGGSASQPRSQQQQQQQQQSNQQQQQSARQQPTTAGSTAPPPPPLLHSIWFNYQPASNNTIFGSEWECVVGPLTGWQDFGGAVAAVGPAGFVQVGLLGAAWANGGRCIWVASTAFAFSQSRLH